MLVKYYFWAIAEKMLFYMPWGKEIYQSLGHLILKNKKGASTSFKTSFRLIRKGKAVIPQGGTVMDIGTGWFHHDAFLLYLVGDYKIYLFDVEDKAELIYIKNYIHHLLSNIDLVSSELQISSNTIQNKLKPLLGLSSREDLYRRCNFTPCITNKTDIPFLPEDSIDFMVSNCVINHIPVHILIPELKSLRKMLKADGCIYFLIGHDDHWAFHDPSANQFNYYRYSDAYYKWMFESFEFQNRLVKQEWLGLFERCGLFIKDYYADLTEESRKQILNLPHIDSRFAKYPLEELAIIHSYVLLQK
jgi:SAM-dependent methyltransferase